jgi:phosphoglycolate phosphatase-like HAD superfamily hydrolase
MQLVMFDIDGTLVDTAGIDSDLYAAAMRSVLGVEVDTTYASYAHVTDSGVLEELLRSGEFGRVTYIGDGPWDQRASAQLGYDFVAVGWGVEHATRFDDLADHDAIAAFLGL